MKSSISRSAAWLSTTQCLIGVSRNDIDNGNLAAEVGVAMIKPAEFVVLSVSHKSASGKT